ncbi:unnamed protein product [Rotaria sp. Silwood2]|nr:unnamed protein product [Rotaria sp. Silwood2]CAF4182193.1 unnamed protein product [Rotaria sp. Silwood2]
MGTLTTAADNRLNTVTDETTAHRYMRTFVDYLDNGIEFSELSQIRQLDIYLKGKKISKWSICVLKFR